LFLLRCYSNNLLVGLLSIIHYSHTDGFLP
jgi:hypothetical protein